MRAPVVVFVVGPPAAGKTTVARELGRRLGLPCFSKDDLKERLFEAVGVRDRGWSRELGKASVVLLFEIAAIEISVGRSLIMDANFVRELDSPRARRLQAQADATFVQVFCSCPSATLRARFRQRALSGERHPGHRDRADRGEINPARHLPLDVEGPVIEVDTSDLARVPFDEVAARVAAA